MERQQDYQPEEKLRRSQPYPLVRKTLDDGSEVDSFVADNGIEYHVYFVSLADYVPDDPFAEDAQELFFDPAEKNINWRRGADPRIGITIVSALKKAFDLRPDLVVMYNCRTIDGFGRMRNIRFGALLSRYGTNYDRLTYERAKGSSVVFYRSGHPYTADIQDAFAEIFSNKD